MRLAQRLVLRYIRTKFKLLSSISKRKAAISAFELFCTPQYRNKKKLPPVFEKAEGLEFPFERSIVRGYRWNKGGEKKVLIMHGFESSAVNFDRYVKPLIRKGYEILAFDAPAHGRSTGKKITAVIYKRMVHQICNRYGPICYFVSHSLGGLALSLYLEEIPHDDSYKAVMIAPAAETTTAVDTFCRFLKLDAGVRKEFDAVIEKKGGHPPSWFSVTRSAKNIRARVLFLQDKNDDMTPIRDVEPIMAANYPNFQFIISEGLGHRRIYRDNKSTKAIIDFL
jgi:pimeloyl-ACP methyl ester carboxylesterase